MATTREGRGLSRLRFSDGTTSLSSAGSFRHSLGVRARSCALGFLPALPGAGAWRAVRRRDARDHGGPPEPRVRSPGRQARSPGQPGRAPQRRASGGTALHTRRRIPQVDQEEPEAGDRPRQASLLALGGSGQAVYRLSGADDPGALARAWRPDQALADGVMAAASTPGPRSSIAAASVIGLRRDRRTAGRVPRHGRCGRDRRRRRSPQDRSRQQRRAPGGRARTRRSACAARGARCRATHSVHDAVLATGATFIAVPTPAETDGSLSLDHVLRACREIGGALRSKRGFHTVALTSTVMPGSTGGAVTATIADASGKRPQLGLRRRLRAGVRCSRNGDR